MSTERRTTKDAGRAPGTPGRFSRWMQRRSNERLVRKVRGGTATFMGMDVLVLHTVGRRSGAPRETPLMWLPDEGAAHREVPEQGRAAVPARAARPAMSSARAAGPVTWGRAAQQKPCAGPPGSRADFHRAAEADGRCR